MKVDVKIPEVGESITEVTIAAWLVEEGEYVEKDQSIAEIESDKATLELPSEEEGTITFKVEEGSDVEVGSVVAQIDTNAEKPEGSGDTDKASAKEEQEEETATADIKGDGKASKQEESDKKETAAPAAKSDSYAAGHPSPAAAKLMSENNISAKNIEGTGKDGRITKADVQEALAKGVSDDDRTNGQPDVRQGNFSREERREKMSRLRKTVSKHLLASKNQTAMLTTFNEVDMTAIMNIRKQYKEKFKETHEIGLGFMSFFTKACCIALQEYPAVNGQIDEDHIVYHDYCDIGIAVSTDRGLVVPVIRNAESLTFAEIESKVMELAVKGRDNKLTLEEMSGGTFTISNGGVFGSLLSTPILNAPQSAILGMHKIEQRPVAIDGKVEVRPMMYVAVSYDHRIIDGKQSVSFLVKVKEMLENPERMLYGDDPMKVLLGL